MATTYLKRTQTTGNQRTFTISAWVKRSGLTANNHITSMDRSGPRTELNFKSDDTIGMSWNPTGSTWYEYITTAKFRDVSGWYHVVATVDTTESVDTDRIKIYVNGVVQTLSGSSSTLPTLNFDTGWNVSGNIQAIGRYEASANAYWNGLMSHIHWIDGTAYPASTFGDTDATTGEWKIKTSPSVTYGTNGFFLLKDGNSVTDQSGEGNNFTVGGGTLTNTEDNPSDVFCTGNPLATKVSATPTFSNGNTVMTSLSGPPYDVSTVGTLGMSKGKFYWECKWTYGGSASNQALYLGIVSTSQPMDTGATMKDNTSYNNVVYAPNGGDLRKNGADVGTDYAGSVNSIFGFALDLDNGTLKIHENGTYFNSGTAVVTGITADTYVPLLAPNGGSTTSIISANFGNGYFGTTAITSEGTNASNIGKFEYDVPTGYTALSTKGLNE